MKKRKQNNRIETPLSCCVCGWDVFRQQWGERGDKGVYCGNCHSERSKDRLKPEEVLRLELAKYNGLPF